jgi:hypothetical protein
VVGGKKVRFGLFFFSIKGVMIVISYLQQTVMV